MGVRGSNPLSSTKKLQVRATQRIAVARRGSLIKPGELSVEVSLDGRGDERDRLVGWHRCQGTDLPDVAHHRQPDDLRSGERGPPETLVVIEPGRHGVEDVHREV